MMTLITRTFLTGFIPAFSVVAFASATAQDPIDLAVISGVVSSIDSASDGNAALLSFVMEKMPPAAFVARSDLRTLRVSRLSFVDPPPHQPGEELTSWLKNVRRYKDLYTIGEVLRTGSRAVVTVYDRQPFTTLAGAQMIGMNTFEFQLERQASGVWVVVGKHLVYSLTGYESQ